MYSTIELRFYLDKLCNEDEIKSWTSHEEIGDQRRLTRAGEDELFSACRTYAT